MERQPMSEIIRDTIDKVSSLADTKTVIGEPISLVEGVTIIPVSKISVGTGLGGGEYGTKISKNKDGSENKTADNFGGGGGAGITVTPVAFLVITSDGEAKLLNIGENSGYGANPIVNTVFGIDSALDKAPEIINKVKALFPKKNNKEENTQNPDETGSGCKSGDGLENE